jgi:hypothetical protein
VIVESASVNEYVILLETFSELEAQLDGDLPLSFGADRGTRSMRFTAI